MASTEYLHLRKDLSRKDLAEIYCKLNAWQWDERLGEKPAGFDQMSHKECHLIVWPLIMQIRMLVDKYSLEREWHFQHCNCETVDEYDAWYSANVVQPALDEWKTLQKGRNCGGGNTNPPNKKVLKHLPNGAKDHLSRILTGLTERFHTK